MTFNHILEKYRKLAFSERDKGDRFERLMQAYLLTDPTYTGRFKKVWLWNEFPGRKACPERSRRNSPKTGIDLVALTFDGDYWAIQCKCVAEGKGVDKPALDSFLSTSSRQFKDEKHETRGFALRLWISTSNGWGKNAEEAIHNQHPPFQRISLSFLQQAPVDWDKLEQGLSGDAARTEKKDLRPHQRTAMNNTHACFQESDRGKLIMACGTGKTFASLRIAENETHGKGLILFLVPSIALLGQTLREWSANANEGVMGLKKASGLS